MLVISPFSRGALVCSDVFDHTSLLRFIETRFGAEVPNLSAWRRGAVGDLTTAFNFAAPNSSVPALPQPSALDPRVTTAGCLANTVGLVGDTIPGLGSITGTVVQHYPVTVNSTPPPQEPGTARRPSGPVACPASAPPAPGPLLRALGALGGLLGGRPLR
jgi:phospholipase C